MKLLKLFPGQHNDTLGGQLITRDNKNHEALSYYWAPKIPSPPEIRILAQHEWTSLPITRNLESALRHLRYEKKERKLWVDALCIDQENEVEKSEQIPIMGRTYSQATNVCVWLGPESETSPLAFAQIRRILDLQTFDRLVDEQDTRDWAALSELMRRPWFSRRWVVQEIAFAKTATVHCGTNNISWPDLADAVALFGSRGAEIAQLFKQDKSFGHRADFLGDVEALGANRLVQTIGKLFRKADDGQRLEKLLSLESLVSNLSAFNFAKPHDIIYAVLSLANDTIASAKASESFLQRRVSITGPFARPTFVPEQGPQKSGAKFSNEELERRHTDKGNLGPIKEQDVEDGNNARVSSREKVQAKPAKENESLDKPNISSPSPLLRNGDHNVTTSMNSAPEPNPVLGRTSDQPLKQSASAATQDTLQSRSFPADLMKRIRYLGFTQKEALEALGEEDGDFDRACDRLNKEKRPRKKSLRYCRTRSKIRPSMWTTKTRSSTRSARIS